jgi:hypothetical protein
MADGGLKSLLLAWFWVVLTSQNSNESPPYLRFHVLRARASIPSAIWSGGIYFLEYFVVVYATHIYAAAHFPLHATFLILKPQKNAVPSFYFSFLPSFAFAFSRAFSSFFFACSASFASHTLSVPGGIFARIGPMIASVVSRTAAAIIASSFFFT